MADRSAMDRSAATTKAVSVAARTVLKLYEGARGRHVLAGEEEIAQSLQRFASLSGLSVQLGQAQWEPTNPELGAWLLPSNTSGHLTARVPQRHLRIHAYATDTQRSRFDCTHGSYPCTHGVRGEGELS